MTPDGWEGLQLQSKLQESSRCRDYVDRLYLRVFGSDDGQAAHPSAITDDEQPTWYPGEDASHGFAREGRSGS